MLPPVSEGCNLAAALAIDVLREIGTEGVAPPIPRASAGCLDCWTTRLERATPTGIEPVLTDRQSAVLAVERRSPERDGAGGGGRTRAFGMGARDAAVTPHPHQERGSGTRGIRTPITDARGRCPPIGR